MLGESSRSTARIRGGQRPATVLVYWAVVLSYQARQSKSPAVFPVDMLDDLVQAGAEVAQVVVVDGGSYASRRSTGVRAAAAVPVAVRFRIRLRTARTSARGTAMIAHAAATSVAGTRSMSRISARYGLERTTNVPRTTKTGVHK
jgi:hypothetical protein